MKEILRKLALGRPLAQADVERAVGYIMDGAATPAQVGALLMGLRLRGETTAELVAATRAVRGRCIRVDVAAPVLDTCGTGGDGLGMFNVSTAAALVAAAAGARVAKHGNRAASGKVGAADVLEAAGVRLELPPQRAVEAIERFGFAFLFAPVYHPAFKFVAGPRREVGVPTLFNLLGPLCNPAGATHQLLGLADAGWMDGVAEALRELGCVRALVVNGTDGSDEITLTGPTAVIEVDRRDTRRYRLTPEELGYRSCRLEDLAGGETAAENAERLIEILSGAEGPLSDVVAVNAGAALYVAGIAATIGEGVKRARGILASGKAERLLRDYITFTSTSP